MNYRYTFEDKVYDVSKLTLEAVSCFELLANVNDRIDDFQNEVTIAQASAEHYTKRCRSYWLILQLLRIMNGGLNNGRLCGVPQALS